jgi:hypothetical protein
MKSKNLAFARDEADRLAGRFGADIALRSVLQDFGLAEGLTMAAARRSRLFWRGV